MGTLSTGTGTGTGTDGRGGLVSVLADVRDRTPPYRRWRERRLWRHPDTTPPWSEDDEELIARLSALDPWWLRSVAGELERVGSRAEEVGTVAARVAGTGVGASPAETCVRLAVSTRHRAAEAVELAAGVHAVANQIEESLETAVRRVLSAADLLAPRPAWSTDPDAPFERHAALLRVLRVELVAAIGLLPGLFGRVCGTGEPDESPRWLPGSEESEGSRWCPGDQGCAGESRVGESSPAREPRWLPDERGPAPEPGDGPLMPGTGARRVQPGEGVRIARL